jgi:hypothetical protein
MVSSSWDPLWKFSAGEVQSQWITIALVVSSSWYFQIDGKEIEQLVDKYI